MAIKIIICLGLIIQAFCFDLHAQCLSHQQFWDSIIAVENSNNNTQKKLDNFIELKKRFENCGVQKDSVYARMLHRIGFYEYSINQSNLTEPIKNTLQSIRINTSHQAGDCLPFTAVSYMNLGYYYKTMQDLNKALLYFDSCIFICKRFPAYNASLLKARFERGNIFYRQGNFEKDIQETTLGLSDAEKINDSASLAALLLERSQSLTVQEKYSNALDDINKAFALLKNLKKYDSWANAYRYKAEIMSKQSKCTEAFDLYKLAIAYRKLVDPLQTAVDYNDAGELLMNNCNDISKAKKYFDTAYTLALSLKYNYACALAKQNLAEIYFEKKDYSNAVVQIQEALQYLFPHYNLNNILANPTHKDFLLLDSKSLAEIIMDNKSEFLLALSNQKNNNQYLHSSVAVSLLNDSIITDLRHEQYNDKNKLYWRNITRDFFNHSLEACYRCKKSELAFYFMEKSRAALLNDKLNELGAEKNLPLYENKELQDFLNQIAVAKQNLSTLADTSVNYKKQHLHLLAIEENFEKYLQYIQTKYPAYYQYKYDDKVPSLKDLQQYLGKTNQSFVHYFFGDTSTYILAVTSNKTNFIHLSQKEFNKEQLADFIKLCANKQALNNNYTAFAQLSNSIYKKIFQPLQLPKGRVIICTDNAVIPFDALCSDVNGEDFLLKNYSFSYVYSALSLMRPFKFSKPQGNFVGFAPVSFEKYLHVQDLKNAADALNESAAFYSTDKLFTHQKATRNNFFNYASSYSVVNIFSHARADTSDNEPVLFMQDSLIHLSELQLLNNPATQLVLLSACQTNVGKAETGEGIYSLARGFATAGIPSVSATLWKADEQAIYVISQKFNQYLSEGMNKDEALQKAKLDFIKVNKGSGKLLPYFWANMILIGNADALKLSNSSSNNYVWIISIAVIILLIAIIFIIRKKTLK